MKKIGSILLIMLILIFSYIAYDYISYRTKNAVSDAAFIKTDTLLTLSFKVDGKVVKMLKKEGDSVKKGELLALIDDKDYKVALERVKKEIDSLVKKEEVLSLKRERIKNELDINEGLAKDKIEYLKSKIEAFKLKISADTQNLKKLQKDEKRYKKLLHEKLISRNDYEKVKTKLDSLKDLIAAQNKEIGSLYVELESAKKGVQLSTVKKRVLSELDKEIISLKNKIEALKKRAEELKNKIFYCKLYAPTDAIVAKKFINKSYVIKRGYPVYSIVNPKDLHVEVLLSEKKLKGVKEGNSVKIKVDAYPNKEFKGVVQKILPASAATFSLVPRDIASGEFTKLDQRFTIRIKILNPTEDLRVGMGATVAIQRN
ncbi:HlyD family secretion protein [Nitrosophilus labii]|uniref:HlyD family secretion protein n=1 Tax=Nitrosophilus labii TaxID=2706014 RepID=UPI001656D127|nr:HlyD family efflux transporter periplasmic adaptor subunit [Nitrosophilus labii]